MGDTEDSGRLQQLRSLGAALEELKTSEGWKAWLMTAVRFREYSAGNTILIWTQFPSATMVRGYKAWQKLGRQVRKGSRGIRIMAPMVVVEKRDDDADLLTVRFRAVSVFDISQTDGAPLPDAPEDVFTRVVLPDDDLFEHLCAKVNASPTLTLNFATAGPNGARGWYQPKDKSVNIVENTPASMTRTLLHELGHAHDLIDVDDLADTDYVEHRDVFELVAEASAWLVAQQLGIHMDEPTLHYLAGWGASDDDLLKAADRVMVAARGTEKLLLDVDEPATV